MNPRNFIFLLFFIYGCSKARLFEIEVNEYDVNAKITYSRLNINNLNFKYLYKKCDSLNIEFTNSLIDDSSYLMYFHFPDYNT